MKSPVCFLVILGCLLMFTLTACNGDGEETIEFGGFTINFNEIVGTAPQGTPQNLHGAFNEEISLPYANRRLRIDLQQCIPDSLYDFDIFIEASYLQPEELFQYNILIHERDVEPDLGKRLYEKGFYISITNRHFSPRGGIFYGTNYASSSSEVSSINGVDVVFQTRDAPVFENTAADSGRERYPVYVADFRIGGLGFFVTGRGGITEEEFLGFVIAIIMNYSV